MPIIKASWNGNALNSFFLYLIIKFKSRNTGHSAPGVRRDCLDFPEWKVFPQCRLTIKYEFYNLRHIPPSQEYSYPGATTTPGALNIYNLEHVIWGWKEGLSLIKPVYSIQYNNFKAIFFFFIIIKVGALGLSE